MRTAAAFLSEPYSHRPLSEPATLSDEESFPWRRACLKRENVGARPVTLSYAMAIQAMVCVWGLLQSEYRVQSFSRPASHGRPATTSRVRWLMRFAVASKQRHWNDNHTLQPVQPRSPVSDQARQRAVLAQRVEPLIPQLDAVDTKQLLDLLSENYLFPTRTSHGSSRAAPLPTRLSSTRPKGRPEMVPGAMRPDTMLEYQERTSRTTAARARDRADTKRTAFTRLPPMGGKKRSAVNSANPITKTRPKSEQGTTSRSVKEDKEVSTAKVLEQEAKMSSPVLGVAPPPSFHHQQQQSSLDLQRYYQTVLLTHEEEYSLGMKVHFMVACEEVHEGIALQYGRLPTFVEWAAACGFTDPDPTFVPTEADEQLRPSGCDDMFMDTDPNLFVGNGLAHDAGPGRGRGRVKKNFPTSLSDVFDVTPNSDQAAGAAPLSAPVNRGTPTDFVEVLMAGREAKQRMVQSNMRLVVSIARKYANVGVSLQDLVQEGSLGLSRAAEKFEPRKGFKFSTYASWWIQQSVFRSIAYHSRTIRLPVHIHNLLNRVRKVRNGLQRELNRVPTNEEMAQRLHMPVYKYNKMLRLTRRSISLETPKYKSNPKDLGHESDDLIGDSISATSVLQDESTPQKRVDRGLFHNDLMDMLEILNEDEKRVISARYGLSDGLTRTVTTVAAQMKQSKAWVRSQECRALRKLRRPWYEKKLKEHEDALTS
jgi:RNA polymerase primary sigma factor